MMRVIAAAALALLAAACSGGSLSATGSGSSPGGGGSTNSPSAVAYSVCMRSHGVPNFPDRDSGGGIPKETAQQLGISSSQFLAAQDACHQLLPATGGSFDQQEQQCYEAGDCPPALVRQMLTGGLKFAQCMRARAVPNWPDPATGPNGGPFFNISSQGITFSEWHSSQMRAKADECDRVAGGGLATG